MDDIHGLFTEFRNKREEIEISIAKMKEDIAQYLDSIVLYGAGSAGIAFLKYLQDAGISPCLFSDGNDTKWGTKCEGLEIVSPEDICRRIGKKALVIVTINTDGKRYCKSFAEALRVGGHTGVHRKLKECGCEHVIDYTYFRRCHELFQGDTYNLPSCSDVNLMESHEQEIQSVFELLADEQSREVFTKLIRFRLLDDSIEIPSMEQEMQYFEYSLYPRRKQEIFVDCGAYNGIGLKTFLKENENDFKLYYGLEPDAANREQLIQYVQSLPLNMQKKMQIFDTAAYSDTGRTTLYALGGPGSFISELGKTQIPTIKIDEMLQGDAATYIKMNIEGAELHALRGAAHTVRTYHPRLAIAGYHKTWDLWEIPLLMQQYYADYKIYLRTYMNHISFVYYAC